MQRLSRMSGSKHPFWSSCATCAQPRATHASVAMAQLRCRPASHPFAPGQARQRGSDRQQAPVIRPSGKERGFVSVALKFTPQSAGAAAPPQQASGALLRTRDLSSAVGPASPARRAALCPSARAALACPDARYPSPCRLCAPQAPGVPLQQGAAAVMAIPGYGNFRPPTAGAPYGAAQPSPYGQPQASPYGQPPHAAPYGQPLQHPYPGGPPPAPSFHQAPTMHHAPSMAHPAAPAAPPPAAPGYPHAHTMLHAPSMAQDAPPPAYGLPSTAPDTPSPLGHSATMQPQGTPPGEAHLSDGLTAWQMKGDR
jgi:hypothetical protein